MKFTRFFVAAAVLGVFALATNGDAQAASDNFYKGKRITLIVGYTAGGGYDTYTRLLGRHMMNHIPGNPNIIVKNRAGAGSIIAANYIATIAPKDGTVFGTFSRSLPLSQLIKSIKLPFDAFNGLTYLGSLSSFKNDAYMLLVRSDTPFKTVKDLQDPSLPAPHRAAP